MWEFFDRLFSPPLVMLSMMNLKMGQVTQNLSLILSTSAQKSYSSLNPSPYKQRTSSEIMLRGCKGLSIDL